MADDIHVPASAVAGSFLTLAIGLAAWVIKVAARQTLEGFKAALNDHTTALRELSSEVAEHRREMAELKSTQAAFNERLKALERGGFRHEQGRT